ncbi:MAG: IS66 family transposase [Pseudomonadota bacterium]
MENTAEILQENTQLKEILSEKDSIIQRKTQRIQLLEEFIRSLQQKQFGASSEKLAAVQPDLFVEAEDEVAAEAVDLVADDQGITIAAHQRKKQRLSIPAELPRVDIIHDLPENQKVCPHDGTTLKLMGHESHEQLEIIPAKIQVLHHKRLKYACPCCSSYLVTANKPAQPIEKSIASPALLAYVTTQKYVDGLPLYRQTEIFKRIGIDMDRSTLATWMVKCGQLVQPLINLIHEKMLEQSLLHMDETRVQVLNEPGRAAQAQSFMWVLRSTMPTCSAVLFHYEPTRSGAVAQNLLCDFSGALMVDGYAGYNAVCQKNAIVRLGCWAHTRRKFVEAQQAQPTKKTGKADQALAYIQQLYRIEQDIKEKSSSEKLIARQQHAKLVIDKIKLWLDKSVSQSPPQSAIGKALYYLQSQWLCLIRYIESGDYPIDNNAAENAIRPFVVGRKAWLFSASQNGATSSANLYSLIETAKANGLEPHAYLKKIFTELPNVKTVDDVESLLPWNCKAVV